MGMVSKPALTRSLTSELNLQVVRVLVVDDDEVDQENVRRCLANSRVGGFFYDTAYSALDALDLLEKRNYDVCLLDYRLGGVDAFDVLDEMRARGHHLPIVLTTGTNVDGIDLLALKHGAADYLDKAEITPPLLERSLRYAVHQHRLQSKLEQLADHDAVTGLLHHRSFKERLNDALARAQRNGLPLGLLFLDLDKFKPVNDRYGHVAGDTVLHEIANRLVASVRNIDTVGRIREEQIGRLGGDEFAVILEGLKRAHDAEVVAAKLHTEIVRPIAINGATVSVGVSIGIAVFPEDSNNVDRLLQLADTAMYHAKEHGGAGYERYQPHMDTNATTWSDS